MQPLALCFAAGFPIGGACFYVFCLMSVLCLLWVFFFLNNVVFQVLRPCWVVRLMSNTIRGYMSAPLLSVWGRHAPKKSAVFLTTPKQSSCLNTSPFALRAPLIAFYYFQLYLVLSLAVGALQLRLLPLGAPKVRVASRMTSAACTSRAAPSPTACWC